jgi:catechol 2,3-dioxygenase-like lactoylglutathione lyase family enzyme
MCLAAPYDPESPSTELAMARAFYCDALRGELLWESGEPGAERFWFLVGGAFVEAGADLPDSRHPIRLRVADPCELAERCWDAGFAVDVGRDGDGRQTVSVIDPFGRRVGLAAYATPTLALVADEEPA